MFGFSKQEKFFTAAEVAYINEAMRYTPDVYLWSCFKHLWLFTYSKDQFGHPGVIEGAEYYPNEVYTATPYSLWIKSLGAASFAIMLDECNLERHVTHERIEKVEHGERHKFVNSFEPMVKPDRVKGSLTLITPDILYKLDEHYRNTVEFHRRRITLISPFRFQFRDKENNLKVSDNYTQLITAHTYVGDQKFWDKQIYADQSLFKSAKHRVPEEKDFHYSYYEFDKLTYDE